MIVIPFFDILATYLNLKPLDTYYYIAQFSATFGVDCQPEVGRKNTSETTTKIGFLEPLSNI